MESHLSRAACSGGTRSVAGTHTAGACYTGGILIVFHVKPPRTTTAASRFPGCAGRPIRPTTSGGRRSQVIPATVEHALILDTPVLTHDLIRLREPIALAADALLPAWVQRALRRNPWVVVRRAAGQ